MTQWATFIGITGVVLVLLLVLSHLTQSSFSDADLESASDGTFEPESRHGDRDAELESDPDPDSDLGPDTDLLPDAEHAAETGTGSSSTRDAHDSAESIHTPSESSSAADRADSTDGVPTHVESDTEATRQTTESTADRDGVSKPGRGHDDASKPRRGRDDEIDPSDLSTGMLLANVALSQGLFALVLLGAVIYTGIPADALGIEFSVAYLETGLIVGTVAGIGLYVGNEIGAAIATRFGFDHDEQLRELLAPDSARGWAILLLVVLPIIAVFEELLFRAALIGVVSSAGYADPWLLAVLSSIAFAIGHGMQGSVGVIVTGLLGFVLAAIFIVTGSFLVVVVAHYLINALEFVVHEGFGFDWADTLEGRRTDSSADASGDSHS